MPKYKPAYKKSNLGEIAAPYAAMFATTLIWAIAGPVIKLTLQDIPPFSFLLLRFGLSSLILLPYMFVELRRQPINMKDLPNIIILGIFGQTALIILFIGLQYTTAIDAAIIATISPILVYIFGYYFFGEKITKLEKVGLALATLGTLIVTLEPLLSSVGNGHAIAERLFGNFLVFLYQLTWPAYVIIGKRMMGQKSKNVDRMFHYFHLKKLHEKYDPMILTSLTFYVGAITLAPFAIIEAFSGRTTTLNLTSVSGLIYMAVFSSIIAYAAFQWSIKRIEASESALFTYISPILTIPPAYILLGEIPSRFALYGMLVIGIGVFLAEKYKN